MTALTTPVLTAVLGVYVVTSLTIPFWVPIVKRITGDSGVFWVFSVLTYYAYLAWVIFALILGLAIVHLPPLGILWLLLVLWRVATFVRLGARSPAVLAATGGMPLAHCELAPAAMPLPAEDALGGADEEAAVAPIGASPPRECGRGGGKAAGRAAGGGHVRTSVRPAAGARTAVAPPAAAAPATTEPRAGAGGRCVCGGPAGCGGCGCGGREEEETPGLGRVVLVGNGPSIRDRGLGAVIDGFDTVVRFNSFVTKGLEEHTGSRTSLWCHMMQWYHIPTVEVAQKAAWLPTCYAWNHVVLAPLVFVPGYLMPTPPAPRAITWSLATYWRAHRRLGLRLHQVPTTGFVMLVRLLESVDTVHLAGFDGFSIGKELHYYKERKRQVRVNAAGALLHDWAKEQAAILRLIDEGRVVLL